MRDNRVVWVSVIATVCALAVPATAAADPNETFDSDNAGWRVAANTPGNPQQIDPAPWQADAGNPGGGLTVTDAANESDSSCMFTTECAITFASSVQSDSPWDADLSHHFAGSYSFDVLSSGPGSLDGLVLGAIFANDGSSLQGLLDPPSSVGGWESYTMTLSAGSGDFQFCEPQGAGCGPATAEDIYNVLSDSGQAVVLADPQSGAGETVNLDNVELSGGTGPPDNDGDGDNNFEDNCLNVANPTQANRDGDAFGDACDPDDDGDGVNDGADKCKTIKALTASGCPAVARTLTLAYKAAKQKFTGTLSASKPQCKSAQVVSVFKQRPGADLKLGQATTTSTGTYALNKPVGSGKYYSSVPLKVVPNVAQCNAAKSPVLTR